MRRSWVIGLGLLVPATALADQAYTALGADIGLSLSDDYALAAEGRAGFVLQGEGDDYPEGMWLGIMAGAGLSRVVDSAIASVGVTAGYTLAGVELGAVSDFDGFGLRCRLVVPGPFLGWYLGVETLAGFTVMSGLAFNLPLPVD